MSSRVYSAFEMKKGLVSIVVPIYNTEQYLDRCIESVVNQTYRNLEIILVDDGSPDSCPQKCDEWAAKDGRIKVIHKENEGAGLARNTGIDHATGEYICFFDSDDYVAIDTIEKAYHQIKKYDAEIVIFGFYNVSPEGKIKKRNIPQTDSDFYEGEAVQTFVLPNLIAPDPRTGKSTNLWMSAWACMYSMQTIRKTNWRFVSERQYISEDSYSSLLLYKDLASVAVLSEALYFYCENRVSFSRTYRIDRYERIKDWYDACIKVCNELGYGERVTERIPNLFVGFTIGAMKIITCADCNRREKKAGINAILKDKKLYEIISGMNIKHQNLQRKALLIAIKYRLYELARLMIMVKAARDDLEK